jgi:hypothetical protein
MKYYSITQPHILLWSLDGRQSPLPIPLLIKLWIG